MPRYRKIGESANPPVSVDDGKGVTTVNGYRISWIPPGKAAYTRRDIPGSYAARIWDHFHNTPSGKRGFETRAKAEAWARQQESD